MTAHSESDSSPMTTALRLMQQHPEHPWTVAELAAVTGSSALLRDLRPTVASA